MPDTATSLPTGHRFASVIVPYRTLDVPTKDGPFKIEFRKPHFMVWTPRGTVPHDVLVRQANSMAELIQQMPALDWSPAVIHQCLNLMNNPTEPIPVPRDSAPWQILDRALNGSFLRGRRGEQWLDNASTDDVYRQLVACQGEFAHVERSKPVPPTTLTTEQLAEALYEFLAPHKRVELYCAKIWDNAPSFTRSMLREIATWILHRAPFATPLMEPNTERQADPRETRVMVGTHITDTAMLDWLCRHKVIVRKRISPITTHQLLECELHVADANTPAWKHSSLRMQIAEQMCAEEPTRWRK